MKKVGILYHPLNDSARLKAEELHNYLSATGIATWTCSAWEEKKARSLLDDTGLILSIGGDGTILRAAQVVIGTEIPITGINLGNLGFMTELKTDEINTRLAALLQGEGWLDKRTVLEAAVPAEKATGLMRTVYALNDVVLARGAIVRMVTIETTVDNEPFITYRADGLIVATATGSTGYSLSAGGPILHPHATEILMTPILPHLRRAQSLILPESTVIALTLKSANQATLSIDGHINLPVSTGETITIKRSTHTVSFLRSYPENSYYVKLEQKLK
ncbi:MAG: NAD(+)/NADH kinase [Dehalococcoidales bacterium]|nr:NAD(+)/NADH kinase [Dehalococcoidales bacterium]